MNRIPILTHRSTPWLLAGAAAIAALASEVGRLLIKGQDYAYASFNDIHFYTAMVFNLWGDPVSVGQEVADRGFSLSSEEWLTFYGGENDFWATHVYPENGLSHQPPWAHRIAVPTVVAGLRFVGMPLEAAFLIVYVFSAALFAVSAFRLLRPFIREQWWAAAVSLGVLTAALAATSPGYPDMTYLSFAMLAVLCAYRNNGLGFALAGFAAGLTRETALLLIASWLALIWVRGRMTWSASAFAVGPLAGFLVPRILVQVPNSGVDYWAMIADTAVLFQTVFWALMPLILVAFVSPVIVRWRVRPDVTRIDRVEISLVVLASIFVLATSLLSLASSRMALLVLPLVLAPASWRSLHSPMWLVAGLLAIVGYAAGDTLAFRADALFGPFPWLGLAILAGVMKIVAIRAERAKDRIGAAATGRAE